MIPVIKELHDRYHDRGVVFVGIHTAGTDMSLIERLLKQQEWKTVVGLDTGEDINTGATVQTFGINSYPTVMVIDGDGKISFNSGDLTTDEDKFLREIEQLARSIGLPWPLDKDADEEKMKARMTRLNLALYGRQIDRALAGTRKP
jgi:hypothetical protein